MQRIAKTYVLVSVASCLLLTGCYWKQSEVSDDREKWGNYNPDLEYFTTVDLFIIASQDKFFDDWMLIPDDEYKKPGLWSGPESMKDFVEQHGTRFDKKPIAYKRASGVVVKVFGILEAGRKLKLSRLVKHSGCSLFTGGSVMLVPFAKIMDGPFKGKQLNISPVSTSIVISHTKRKMGYYQNIFSTSPPQL